MMAFNLGGFFMNMKTIGLISAGAAMLCLATIAGVRQGNLAHADGTGESGMAEQQVVPRMPNLTGQWSGTATIFGEPASIVINVSHGEDTANGMCSINGLPATPFAIEFSRQQGNLSGTWSVDDRHPRPFSGSFNSQGQLELTLNAGAGKHPNCAIDVNGRMSDDDTEIAGVFKLSDGCKNQGQTGTFQVISQG
jgi:hypothetical protein